MEAVIEKVVHGGYGLARIRGVVCLVPFSVPGDVLDVECSLDHEIAFGWIKRIIEPSPRRRVSGCPVFGLCGGCDYDHMEYACELEVKKGILLEDLARIAKIDFSDLDSVVAAREYGYRNHSQFKVDSNGRLGFFAKKSHEVVPLPEQGCLLLHGCITEYMKGGIGARGIAKGGFRVRTNSRGEIFKKGVPGVPDDSCCFHYLGGLRMRLGIDDFFQVNQFLVEKWVERIESYVEPGPGDEIADLFCGSGIIGLHLGKKVRSVVGVEMNKSAVESARYNARWNGSENVSFVRANSMKGLSSLGRADKIVVDPPRAGLTEDLIAGVAARNPTRIVYASCNTATFARDLTVFAGFGYTLKKLSLVDMFPRTQHSEVVSLFTRER